MFSPGCRIGSFEVVRWLGRGAFADVYEARQVLMDRPVALKVITCDQRPSDEQLGEARLLASLSHPNIVQIYDCNLHTDRETGRTSLYLATELATGGTLRERLASSGRLSAPEATQVALAVSEALAYAHARGIVHRDVKPENILLKEDGTPTLADFGVGRLLAEAQIASSIVGTAPYIAPEGWEGATHQSDIWSVGVLLYEMLSGSHPFTGRTPAEVERRVKRQPHVPLRQVAPDVPAGLEATVDKALQKSPGRRFARMSDLADALRPYSGQVRHGWATTPAAPRGAAQTVTMTVRRAAKGAARFVAQHSAGTIISMLVAGVLGYLVMPVRGCLGIAEQPPGRITSPEATVVAPPLTEPEKDVTPELAPPQDSVNTLQKPDVHGEVPPPRPVDTHDEPVKPQTERPPAETLSAEELYVRALAKLGTGEQAEALSLLKRCVAADPRHAGAHLELARLYEELGKLDLSIAELEIVVGLKPDGKGAREMLARAYARDGKKEKATKQWEAVLRLDPENQEAKQAIAR